MEIFTTWGNAAYNNVFVDANIPTLDFTEPNTRAGTPAHFGAAIPVSIATPVTPNATAVQVNNTPACDDAVAIPTTPYQAQTVTNVAPFAVAATGAVFLAAGAGRRGFRIKNVGANPVAIGAAGLAYANGGVLLLPGEAWNENEAPGAAWSCICDAGLVSTLNIQTIA